MRRFLVAVLFGLTAFSVAGDPASAAQGEYRLEFLPTFNIGEDSPAGGTMTIRVLSDKQSIIQFKVWNLYPDTVYTIWTVFNDLKWRPGFEPAKDAEGNYVSNTVPACSATGGGCTGWKGWADYPREGGKVSPTGAIRSAYTHGIRLDPGSTFKTDRHGNGLVTVKLDFDALDANPVSLKQLLQQCRPGTADSAGKCSGDNLVDVTTTWMREFIARYPLAERAAKCANYDPRFDPESSEFDPAGAHRTDARFWQCVDPDTDLVRVERYPFAHFRIANHPDALTHGHIGGDHNDHWIDLVGPRECIVPVGAAAPIAVPTPAIGTTIGGAGYNPFPVTSCRPLSNGLGETRKNQ
jgi:hypothetical protein